MVKYIAVFCSAAPQIAEKYQDIARDLANLIVENNYNLVWGGSETGLMKIIADIVDDGGKKLFGVSYTAFQDVLRAEADEMIVAESLAERKSRMLEKADAIVTIVGGAGTLDEITEIIELKQAKRHDKPIVIINTDGFFDGLIAQYKTMEQEGFLHAYNESAHIDDIVHFSSNPIEAIEYINKELNSIAE